LNSTLHVIAKHAYEYTIINLYIKILILLFYIKQTCPESAIAQNNNGDCPLHNLVGSDSTSMAVIRLYLDVSDQSLLIKNNKGQSPLDKAEQCGAKDDILELLRQLRKDGKHS
jgi:hypothetical protein